MRKGGFIRKALLVGAITWVFGEVFFSSGLVIQSPSLLLLGRIALLVVAAWAVITLLAQRVEKR